MEGLSSEWCQSGRRNQEANQLGVYTYLHGCVNVVILSGYLNMKLVVI